MQLKSIMTKDVKTISPEASIREAAEIMAEEDIGFLPVANGERIEGAITDRDIVVRTVASGINADGQTVREVMSPEVVYCFEDQELLEAARIMETKQVRRLVVLNREQQITGVVSLGDVSRQSRDQTLSGEVLRYVSEPSTQHSTF